MKQATAPQGANPFDWRSAAAKPAEAVEAPRKARAKKRMTVKERVERIMAQRWGNPYCKPGAA